MIFHKTKIVGLYIIEAEPIKDNRGYFAKIFDIKEFKKNGIDFKLVGANKSFNAKKGTLRGMHFQKAPKSEDKIVQCIKGAIFDVAVDMRPKSKTYGKWIAVELTEDNNKMFLIPKGFAHGFQTLADSCEVMYFMSEHYSPKHASGLRWDDPFLKIKWPLPVSVLSEKDKNWPLIT